MNFSTKKQKAHVTNFDFSQFRERDWQNVLTCGSEAPHAQMWSYQNHSISRVPVSTTKKVAEVTAVAVTQCGNFGCLGFKQGHITKFNLQSGTNPKPFEGD